MSVSLSSVNAAYTPNDSNQATAVSATSSGAVSQKATSAPPEAPASTPSTPSTTVTLSSDAVMYSKLASQGMTVTQSSLNGLTPPQNASNNDMAKFLKSLAAATISAPTDGKKYIGSVSEQDFQTLAMKFGATQADAHELFQALYTDANGETSNSADSKSISHSELLKALGNTTNGLSDSSKQSLLSLMDGNKDGSVNSSEFLKFETAFVAAEKTKT